MEISAMLVRLEHALNYSGLAKQMVLVPAASPTIVSGDINLVVGYNGSARSQTALDLTLWIAHQTRLATQRSVKVQVVYVVDSESEPQQDRDLEGVSLLYCSLENLELAHAGYDEFTCWEPMQAVTCGSVALRSSDEAVVSEWSTVMSAVSRSTNQQIHQFEKADRILWQARHLANEWRGSLETHLRFGCLAKEMAAVTAQVSPTALILGCASAKHPLVQALGENLPFPILGIPSKIG